MSDTRKLIRNILPNKNVFYRLRELFDHRSERESEERIVVSIEESNHTRKYCELSLEELELLYVLYPKMKRCFYECLTESNMVKAYIDFEYLLEKNSSVDHDKAIMTCLKILSFHLNGLSESSMKANTSRKAILNQFLILDASTSSKKSCHFIHANPNVLFENTKALDLFIKTIFQSLLFSVAKHICSSFNLNIDSDSFSTRDLIQLLFSHVAHLRANCSTCYLLNDEINIADIAHLIVCDKKNQPTLAVDLHVYSRNQQFRLYDCIKSGSDNPLIPTLAYPFEEEKSHSYFEILGKSLLTNVRDVHVPLVVLENGRLSVTASSSRLNSRPIQICDHMFKNGIDTGRNILQNNKSNQNSSNLQSTESSPPEPRKQLSVFYETDFETYLPFVNKIITQDDQHIGRVHSCARGTRNTNKLFFNITGEYRFCPRRRAHHKRNSTAIIIDISNDTFSIRCKDPECDNTNLTWQKIHRT